MSKCDYCCQRPSSLEINCSKCSPSRAIQICYKCSISVQQIKDHAKLHPLSTYQLIDIRLDENNCQSWLCNDEINLIEMIETYGLGNWIDIGSKLNKISNDCQNHFENIYFSTQTSFYSIYFQSYPNKKQLFGENEINTKNDFKYKSIIYPPLLIDNEQQKLLTYMPFRDEYEREYLNYAENRLPILNNDQQDQNNHLLNKAKLTILRSYKQIIQRRLQLKHFIRDYALPFNYSNDQQLDIHQISRFLSADEYERLIFNHKRIRTLLEELGCSTSSKPKKSHRRQTSIADDETSSSNSSSIKSETTFSSFSSTNQSEEINSNLKRRSIRRVSSSSSSSSSRTINTENSNTNKEPLYTRRKSDNQRMTRSSQFILNTSDISWDSTTDEEIHQFDNFNHQTSTVASRTRSHTPPNHHSDKKQKISPNSKRTTNGSSKLSFDPNDESTPKSNRMLTRHQLVVRQTSPVKKRKLNSNSFDEQS